MRDAIGKMLWGALGLMKGMTDLQAVLWGLQSAVVKCHKRKLHKMHFETDMHEAIIVIRYHEEIVIVDEITEVMTMLNTIYANNFQEDETE